MEKAVITASDLCIGYRQGKHPRTFNRVTVDGDTSTNDMCAVLANGMAGNPLIEWKEYYDRSKGHYMLHPETRALLEKLLKMVRDLGQERTFAYMKFLLGCQTDY